MADATTSLSLCSNAQCSNKNSTLFEEKHVCAEDESAEVMLCRVCQTETPKSEWDANFSKVFPVKKRDRKLKVSHESTETTQSTEDPIDNASQEEKDINEAIMLSLQAEDPSETADDQFGSLRLDDDSGGTYSSNIEESIQREVSTESISALISQSGCKSCGSVLSPVQGGDQDMMAWYCNKCRELTGVDDGFTDDEVCTFANDLVDCLKNHSLKIDLCPGECGNDDPNDFVFEFVGEDLFVKCNKCQLKQHISSEQDSTNQPDTEICPIQCDCGNDNLDAFAVYYHPTAGIPYKVRCHVCDAELVFDPELARDDDNSNMSYEEDTFQPPVGKEKVKSIQELQPADHISWHQPLAYWHHAIVAAIGEISKKVKVIHYNGPDKQYGGKGVIKEEWLEIDLTKEDLYRNKYDRCQMPDVVLARARQRLGEAQYSLLRNNCEHFCQWCKTGVAKSGQVESFVDTARNIKNKIVAYASKDSVKQGIRAVKSISSKTKAMEGSFKTAGVGSVTLSETAGVSKGLEKASTAMAKQEAKAAVSGLSKLDYAAMGLVVSIEAYRTCRDINQMHKKKQEGNITHNEFVRFTIKRTSQGVGGASGTVAGGIVGQMLIPIPVVGSIAGATVGAFIGEGLGALLGRKVSTVVDGK